MARAEAGMKMRATPARQTVGMSPIAPGAGVDLAYAEHGTGRPVVLVHDLACDLTGMGPLADAIGAGGDARVIAYSRRGYGASGAPEPYQGTTVAEQSQDTVALLGALDATGALAVGIGFGALVVLDLLLRAPDSITAAVLADPPLFVFAPDATRALAAAHERLEAAVTSGGPRAGVAAWLGDRADADALERACDAHRAFFADYAGLASLPVTRAGLRAIAAPVALVTGSASPPEVLEATDALQDLLADVTRRTDGDVAAAARGLLA
jgi:pimeloyl-ACP methyl ester carboxylesterase